MLHYTKEDLLELGAEITTREIYQQPDVWKEAFEDYQAKREEIAAFLQGIADKHDYIKVILVSSTLEISSKVNLAQLLGFESYHFYKLKSKASYQQESQKTSSVCVRSLACRWITSLGMRLLSIMP